MCQPSRSPQSNGNVNTNTSTVPSLIFTFSSSHFYFSPTFVFRIKFSHILSMYKSPFRVFAGCLSHAIPKLYHFVRCLTLRLWHFCGMWAKNHTFFSSHIKSHVCSSSSTHRSKLELLPTNKMPPPCQPPKPG